MPVTPHAEPDAVTPAKAGQPAVYGPYTEHGGGLRKVYRVVVVGADGKKTARKFATPGDATRFAAAQRAALLHAPKTVGEALVVWLASKARSDAWSHRTWARTAADVEEFATPANTPLRDLNAEFVLRYVDRIKERLSLASCRSRFGAVSGFLEWCRRKGHLLRNPVDDIENDELAWRTKRGKRLMGRGKQQLNGVTEALAYLDQARLFATPAERVAAVLPVLHGLASGEVLHLRVRDIELAGRRLWIRDDGQHPDDWHPKSQARISHIDIDDEWMLRDLAEMVRGADPSAYLFSSHRRPGLAYGDDWLWRRVHWNCQRAGITDVCPHGLRGTYATLLTVLFQARAQDVAQRLRHGDQGQTALRNYIGAPVSRPALRMVRGAAA